ncbi:hypothetical protein F5Y10DRAFT_268675 [Nemania abortiva]|nr:hypothetical protein F5Y10DRAFT_268675 [Nemania abortiva]
MASLPLEPTYTVFIRLPFPRGDFVDPPPANWESWKDEALWSIVSNVSKTELDWNEMQAPWFLFLSLLLVSYHCACRRLTFTSAAKFQVTVDFLLQQVTWLTERHTSQVRAQMRKAAAAAKVSPAPSPQPQALEGAFSTDPPRYAGQPRAPSSASVRRDSPLLRNEQNTPSSSMRSTPRPPPTRTSSTNTAFLTTRNLSSAGKGSGKSGTDAQRHRLTSLPITTNVDDQDDQADQEADSQSLDHAESSSAASSSSSSSPAQSRIIRRPPRFQSNEGTSFADDDDDDEEEVEPAFFRPQTGAGTSGHHDLSATLRGNLRDSGKRPLRGSDRDHTRHSQTSDSSASSVLVSRGANDKRAGPLSPRRTMELAGRSPGGRSKGNSRDSDGTPSMGSSFSDLDDASVTQSALEEALASRMQDGGTISSLRGTMGTFSNAFPFRRPKPSNAP